MNTILVGQQLIVDNEDRNRGYYGIISDTKINAIKRAGKYPPAEYGFQTVALPSREEIERIEAAAMQATQGGKNGMPALTYSEYLFVCDQLKTGKPIKYVMAYIAYMEAKRDKQAQEQAQQNQQANAMSAMMQEEAKAKSKQAEILAQGNVDKEIKMLEIVGEMIKTKGEIDLKGLNDLKKIALQGGIDSAMQQGGQEPGQEQGQEPGQEQMMPPEEIM